MIKKNFPVSNNNSGSSIYQNQNKYKGKRQAPVFRGQKNQGYNKLNKLDNNIMNLNNKPQSSLNNRPVRNNNQQQNNRYLQNQNQFQPNVGNPPDTYSSDYVKITIFYLYQILAFQRIMRMPQIQDLLTSTRPILYNKNVQRSQLAQLQGGGLNRGPLPSDLVYRNNGQNNPNQQNLNRLPFGLQNRQNPLNQQHQSSWSKRSACAALGCWHKRRWPLSMAFFSLSLSSSSLLFRLIANSHRRGCRRVPKFCMGS